MYDYNYIPKVEFVEVQCRDYLILISGIFVLLYGDNKKFVIRNNNNGWSVYNDRQRRWSDTEYRPLYKIVTECIESQIINYYYSESWHYARVRSVYLNTNTFTFYYKGIEYNLQLYKLPSISKLLENNLLNSDKQYLNTRCRHFTVM